MAVLGGLEFIVLFLGKKALLKGGIAWIAEGLKHELGESAARKLFAKISDQYGPDAARDAFQNIKDNGQDIYEAASDYGVEVSSGVADILEAVTNLLDSTT